MQYQNLINQKITELWDPKHKNNSPTYLKMWDIDKEFFENQQEKNDGLDDFLKGTPVLDEIGKNLNSLMKDIDESDSTEETAPSLVDTFKQSISKKVKTAVDHK